MLSLVDVSDPIVAICEGLRLVAYQDNSPKKNWTIGFGHTGSVDGVPIHAGMVITMDKAYQLLAQDTAPLLAIVGDKPNIIEGAALVSFGYNCGSGPLQRVMKGQSRLEDFTHAGGAEDPGLVKRRKFEAILIAASRQVAIHG